MNQKSAPTNPSDGKLNKSRVRHSIFLESYGVRIRIGSNSSIPIEVIRNLLPTFLADRYRLTAETEADHEFFYARHRSEGDVLYKNGTLVDPWKYLEPALDQLGREIRLTVAEFAVGRVFVHAGVVGWKGKAIIIPARSFKGKSTLTAELVRHGALYYSDEYAVLDKNARVHAFPKPLSLRGIKNDYDQVDHSVEVLGGKAGKRPIPVGMVVITEYKKGARWNPRVLNSGRGVMELVDNAVPIRRDPKFAMPILGRVGSEALIISTKRGEAELVAPQIIELLERSE